MDNMNLLIFFSKTWWESGKRAVKEMVSAKRLEKCEMYKEKIINLKNGEICV